MRRLLFLLGGLTITALACAVPLDESATVIEPETLPDALQPGIETTTTTVPVPRPDQYRIFLLTQPAEQRAITEVNRDLEIGAQLTDVIQTLFVEPEPAEFEAGLVSELANELYRLSAVTIDGTVAAIDIVVIDPVTGENAPESEQTIERPLLQDITAQLVWTATSFETTETPITQVGVLVDGQEIALPTPDGDKEVGERVSTADYAVYDSGRVFPE